MVGVKTLPNLNIWKNHLTTQRYQVSLVLSLNLSFVMECGRRKFNMENCNGFIVLSFEANPPNI